jgi:hypothetical protein
LKCVATHTPTLLLVISKSANKQIYTHTYFIMHEQNESKGTQNQSLSQKCSANAYVSAQWHNVYILRLYYQQFINPYYFYLEDKVTIQLILIEKVQWQAKNALYSDLWTCTAKYQQEATQQIPFLRRERKQISETVRFQILTAVNMKMTSFWDLL